MTSCVKPVQSFALPWLIEINNKGFYMKNNEFSIKDKYRDEFSYRCARHYAVEDDKSCLDYSYTSILISEYNHTILHNFAYRGNEKALNRILNPFHLVNFTVDIFGKSPIFYAIKKKHQTSAHLFLNYFIEFKLGEKDLFNILSKLENEFILLINSSLKLLPAFMNKMVFETNYMMIEENHKLPIFFESEINKKPTDYLEPGISDKLTPAKVKYFSIPLPVQVYSDDNIEILKALSHCRNLKIFENLIIEKIVDYNWKNVKFWVKPYTS